ncbi:MAG: TrkH family potassium uptake protein [Prevotellaceae bacterium]|nr:TrkH family potassium uptake protein [Prevotellaceae bacterium]
MIKFKLIYKVIGSLLFIEAMMMFYCFLVSLYYQEDDTFAFIITIAITVLAAIIFKYLGYHAENSMGRRDAYLLVTLTWIVFSVFGALPFIIGGYLESYTDAFFETMSGFTTTGATIIDDVESLPHGLLFWRSLTQWIGGLGIVFFTIAVLPSLVGGSVKVFSAESTGPIKAKMHPRLSTNAKSIWVVYLLLTAGCTGCFYLSGMSLFDSINYSMSITATGGFSTHNASAGYFDSAAIDYTAIIFMLLSGTNFMLLYLAIFRGKLKSFVRDTELRFYLSVVAVSTVVIMYFLIADNDYSLIDSFRYALFQVVSFITTTGIFNDDAGKWHHITWVVLSFCMFLGACGGSTSGGLKSIRGAMLLKIVRNEFRHIIHPRAILPVKIANNNVTAQSQVRLLVFLALYLATCFFAYFCLICMGVDSTNSMTIAISCASNVGPTLGLEIGPTMSWSMLPDVGKWICSILMLIGRLEFFSVLVLFTRAFWNEN